MPRTTAVTRAALIKSWFVAATAHAHQCDPVIIALQLGRGVGACRRRRWRNVWIRFGGQRYSGFRREHRRICWRPHRQGVRSCTGKGSGLVLTYSLFRRGYKAKIAVQRRPSFGVSASMRMRMRMRPGPDSWQHHPIGRALATARSCSGSRSANRSGDRFPPE